MAKYKVTNTSRQVIQRLNYRFVPNEDQVLELEGSDLLAVRSARGLEVEEVSDDTPVDAETVKDGKQLVRNSNVDEVVNLIKSGEMEASEALQYEKEGKNRPTLIEKLEKIAWDVQESENEGNYNEETENEVTKNVEAFEEEDSDKNEG